MATAVQFASDVLRCLDAETIKELSAVFTSHEGGLPLELFTEAEVSRLFTAIDINADGSCDWSEFTSYVLDSGMPRATAYDATFEALPIVDSRQHAAPVASVRYLRNSRELAVIEVDSDLVHLASVSLVYKRPIRTIAGAPLAVDFVAGVQRYAIASSASELALHDREGVRVDAMSLPSTQLCLRAFDDARPLVVAGGVDGRLCMFHAGRADLLFESSPGASHTNAITDVLPVPELDLVVSASLDKSVRLWDATTGAPRRVLSGHTKGVRALAFASDAKLLFSAGFDYDVLVWNPYVSAIITGLRGHRASIVGVDVLPGTNQVITGDAAGFVKVWDLRTLNCIHNFRGIERAEATGASTGLSGGGRDSAAEMMSFCAIPELSRIVAGQRHLRVFESALGRNGGHGGGGAAKPDEMGDIESVVGVCFRSENKTIVVATTRKELLHELPTPDREADCSCLDVDARGRKAAAGDAGGAVVLFDLINGVRLGRTRVFSGADRGVVSVLYGSAHDGDSDVPVPTVTKLIEIDLTGTGTLGAADETVVSSDPSKKRLTLRHGSVSSSAAATAPRRAQGPALARVAASCAGMPRVALGTSAGDVLLVDVDRSKVDACWAELRAPGIVALQFLQGASLLASLDEGCTLALWRAGEESASGGPPARISVLATSTLARSPRSPPRVRGDGTFVTAPRRASEVAGPSVVPPRALTAGLCRFEWAAPCACVAIAAAAAAAAAVKAQQTTSRTKLGSGLAALALPPPPAPPLCSGRCGRGIARCDVYTGDEGGRIVCYDARAVADAAAAARGGGGAGGSGGLVSGGLDARDLPAVETAAWEAHEDVVSVIVSGGDDGVFSGSAGGDGSVFVWRGEDGAPSGVLASRAMLKSRVRRPRWTFMGRDAGAAAAVRRNARAHAHGAVTPPSPEPGGGGGGGGRKPPLKSLSGEVIQLGDASAVGPSSDAAKYFRRVRTGAAEFALSPSSLSPHDDQMAQAELDELLSDGRSSVDTPPLRGPVRARK